MRTDTKREALIEKLAAKQAVHPCVLAALPDWTLRRIAAARARLPQRGANITVEDYKRIAESYNLPGEGSGHSVYRIAFDDGTAYVGLTGQGIVERLKNHLGLERSVGTFRICQRYLAGVRFRVECLASDLTRSQARAIEDREIRKLVKPLNSTPNARPWNDPLLGGSAEDAETNAVAKYYRDRGKRV